MSNSDQSKKRRLSEIKPSAEQSNKPGETIPVSISTLILLPTKEELDRVLFLVYEKEKYKKAIELADRELKELSKKPELANLARSYQQALSGRQKKTSPPAALPKTDSLEGEKKEEKDKKEEKKQVLQLSPSSQTPPPKKTQSQKRREKEKKKKAEERRLKDQEKFDLALKTRIDPSSPFSSLSLSPLGKNHPMPGQNISSSSSSSSSSSLSSSSYSNI